MYLHTLVNSLQAASASIFKPGKCWLVHACLHKVTFLMCVYMHMRGCVPQNYNYIHVFLSLYNKLSKFSIFKNIMKELYP